MRPGRMSAGSSISGWFVVMTRMRWGVSTTPSSTFSKPERFSLSLLDWGGAARSDMGPAPPDGPTASSPALAPCPCGAIIDASVAIMSSGSILDWSSSSTWHAASELPGPPYEFEVSRVSMGGGGFFSLAATPRSSSSSAVLTSAPASSNLLSTSACCLTYLSTDSRPSLMASTASFASVVFLSLLSASPSALARTLSPDGPFSSLAIPQRPLPPMATPFSRADFSISSFTSATTSSSLVSSSSSQGVFRDASTVSVHVTSAVIFPSRRCTILDAASTSSMTNMTSLKPSLMGTSSPRTAYCWSNMMSMSSWFVLMRASGTFTMERPVCWAMALMRLVLPVPGGPCSKSPSLCG
mmetsp:Transcript_36517/g.102959  ORF Transcript_36517/g.102959 Transcript_36517/m.102959 type:complete len:354 (+) Transcript_36517:265-1326(+)